MVVRNFQVSHTDYDFNVEYDTDDGFEIFKIQLFSLTSVPPDEQKIYGWDDGRLLSDDSDLISISEKLRLVSIDDPSQQPQPEDTAGGSSSSNAERFKSDEELARLLQAEEEALMLQQYVAAPDNGHFEARIRPYVDQVRMYEDPKRQEAARRTVSEEELEEKALVALAKEGNFKPSKIEKEHAFLLQLLFWFKRSFSWVHQPPCDCCGHHTATIGMGDPLPSEVFYGASRVELYRCSACSNVTRFPRYNDPLKLVETRSGRCGEWANCFTLYCRAFGYESRLILDLTDHVWTECFSPLLGRWMHLDPCEGIYDKPLLYEMGWNKKLNYVIAISKDGVADVTKRYTRKWNEVLSRRVITTEPALSATLANMTKECRIGLISQMLTLIEDRDKEENEELERNFHSIAETSILLPGRLSGDEEWRKLRSEIGPDKNSSFACFSCPVRLCVDEHVTRIYDAFHPILDGFVKERLSSSKCVEVLEILKSFFLDLRNSPFKARRASMDLSLNKAQCDQFYPPFDELFGVLSLENKMETNGRFDICLTGDPVITSLALPVVLDTLNEVIYNLKKCEDFGKDSLSLPLLKSNRIHSGSVLASGEELPFGIVTAAFDGSNTSKWEEPNGAKGCWIIYKVPNNRTFELAAYELMSANDAPERDPMDWVVEGSNDGGSSWQTIDKQTSQMFPRRYQRRTFVISSPSISSNAFRFHFLAARDVQSNSRLQLGSIDLYGR